jgi:cytochrome c oxidase subunit III
MSMWTLAIALTSALVVWGVLVRYLMAQPWLAAGDPGYTVDIAAIDQPAKKVGLYFFLAAISSLFTLFVTAYIMRMDPTHAGDWFSIPKPGILWINTLLLLYSSVSMQHAKTVSEQSVPKNQKRSLIIGGLFAFLFIGGQLIAWEQLHDSVYFQLSNPALGFFYLLTGLHAVHVLGGLYVWARLTNRVWKNAKPETVKLSIELCTTYWHYLLLVWLVLFVLMKLT